jgi:DNA-binding transcriptional LysR family regulator
VEGTAVLLDELSRGGLDITFATLPVASELFGVLSLYHDPQLVIASTDHPLAGETDVDPKRLGDSAWILHKVESVTRQLVEGFFAAQGVTIRTEMEISSPEAIAELVRANLGVSVLPLRSVERDLEAGRLASIGVRDFSLERHSGLVWRQGRPISRGGRALREIARAESLG